MSFIVITLEWNGIRRLASVIMTTAANGELEIISSNDRHRQFTFVDRCIFSCENRGTRFPTLCHRYSRFNTLRPEQNGYLHADDICECIFVKENVYAFANSAEVCSQVPKKNLASINLVAWLLKSCSKLFPEPMWIKFYDVSFSAHCWD